MPRLILSFLLGAWLAATGSSAVQAQILESDPPQAYMRVEGPVSVSGRSQVPLATLPEGEYRLFGRGPGLAAVRARLEIDGRGLTRRSWSGPEALLKPPGLDHLEKNEGRGWYHLGTAAFSGTMWGLGFQDVDEAEDRIARARVALDLAADETARDAAAVELSDARAESQDERRVRNLWAGYFVTAWVGAGLEAWLLTPEPSFVPTSDGARVRFPRATRWGAAARSALVPGAGQRYLGRNTRANVFSTLVAASAAGAIMAQDSFLEARRKEGALEESLSRADSPSAREQIRAQLEDATSEKDTRSLVRWVFTGTAAYFYVWNVVDALWLGREAERASPGPRVSLSPTPTGMALTMSWRFH